MYTVYKITNTVNQKIYIGVHCCSKKCRKVCKYMGSGPGIKNALKKHGIVLFVKDIIGKYDSREEALQAEKEIVTQAFVKQPNTYNQTIGGNAPPNKTGFKHSDKAKAKIGVASKSRRDQLSQTAKDTIERRRQSGQVWSKEEIDKRVASLKKSGKYSDMKAANTDDAIAKRVASRVAGGKFGPTDHLYTPEVLYKRTRNKLLNRIAAGMPVSDSARQKYNL